MPFSPPWPPALMATAGCNPPPPPRAHQYALVRSLAHRENNHLVATHHLLTGSPQPGAFFDRPASRSDWPCYASALSYLQPRHDGIPAGVNLPTFLAEGPLTWPGQHAGFLGPRHDPWQITRDPSAPGFRVDSLRPAPGIEVARLGDLEATGLLAETLVVMLGEFGRTPKIGTLPGAQAPGRDHWAPCFFGLFAGAGVRGGQVIGRSDRIGAYPATTPYAPDDVGATVYHLLGIDPASEVRDRQDRPTQLNSGTVMQSLFS